MSDSERLADLLALTDDEVLAIFDVSALEVLGGHLETRPELAILLDLLDDVQERVSPAVLRRWARTGSPNPIERLRRHDFAGFEDALAELRDRGFVIRNR